VAAYRADGINLLEIGLRKISTDTSMPEGDGLKLKKDGDSSGRSLKAVSIFRASKCI